MKRVRVGAAVFLALLFCSTGAVLADVKIEERSHVKFEGMLGRMVGLFGGRAAREGVVTTVAVKGDRKMTMTGQTGQLIDLGEEKIYDVDFRRKTYTVTTFDQLRKQMQEAMAKAKEQARAAEAEPQTAEEPRDPEEPQFEVDFDLRESGQRKTVSSFDAREVVMTITVREKDKTLEQSGGILLTANSWLSDRVAGTRTVEQFDRRYAEKLGGPLAAGASMEQMAAALAMYPGLQDALARYQTENVNLEGTPVLTTVTFQAVRSPEQMAQAEREEPQEGPSISGGVGGVLGGLGRRAARGRQTQEQDAGSRDRVTIMTMTHELLKVTPEATQADVSIPADFKGR
jgi:hypothetical protein